MMPTPWRILGRVVALTVGLSVRTAEAQRPIECPRPLSADEVALLASAVPDGRLAQWVRTCGLGFTVDAAFLSSLRRGGASPAFVASLTPPARPTPGRTWLSPADGTTMVWVPQGRFVMGSPATEPGRDDDETGHEVVMAAGLWLDTVEVTNAAYRRFIVANPAWGKARIDRRFHDGNYLADWIGNEFPTGEAAHPVMNVSWYAAVAFARWAGKRLPTEAEWEYAARAGTEGPYWWGETFDSSRANGGARAEPVGGQSRRNAWVLFDMIGNVGEWTSNLESPYPYRADDGREDQAAPGRRVTRGGSYSFGARFLRAANRSSEVPGRCSDVIGFRCARSAR